MCSPRAWGTLPTVVAGSSKGAIIGALYSSLRNAAETEQKVVAQLQNPKMSEMGLKSFQENKSPEFIQRNIQKTLEHLSRIFLLASVLTKDHIIAEEKVKSVLTQLLLSGSQRGPGHLVTATM